MLQKLISRSSSILSYWEICVPLSPNYSTNSNVSLTKADLIGMRHRPSKETSAISMKAIGLFRLRGRLG